MPSHLQSTVMVGRFRLISRLGAGGMGEAFRAWDGANGVPVVLKRPLPAYAHRRDVLERFDREINRLLELPHPHVVPIVEHGHDQTGVPFLVMRFLPGGSLANRTKPQPPSHLHRWLPGVAAALDFAHSRGVLHRDVKPGNIFFDAQGVAFLGDFGIAKLIEDEVAGGADDALTSTTDTLGTTPYMAPEYFRQPRVLTGAYDQYALGITVFELVCGKRPFDGDKGQLIVAHATQQPADVREFFADAPESFCVAVARSLAKKPEERFSTCTALAEAVLRDVPGSEVDESVCRFMCPACGKLVRVPQQFGGREGKCTQCGARLRVSANLDALWLRQEDPLTTTADSGLSPDTSPLTGTLLQSSLEQFSGPQDERTALTAIADPDPPPVLPRTRTWSMLGLSLAMGVGISVVLTGALSAWWVGRQVELTRARNAEDWDRVLALNPADSVALVQRAKAALAKTPPAVEAAFADLEEAESLNAATVGLQAALGLAHALRARLTAESDDLPAAEADLATAEQRLEATAEVLASARTAIAAGWLRETRTALSQGQADRARKASAKAERIGAEAEELDPVRAELLILDAERLEANGSRDAAVRTALEALTLNEPVAQAALQRSGHTDLRQVVLAGLNKRRFDAAFADRDWNAAWGIVTTEAAGNPTAWEWLKSAIDAQPEALSTMPPAVLGQLPYGVLEAIPVSAIGRLPSLENGLGMRFRLIPAGSFQMGEAAEEAASPPHTVTLSRLFFLGTCEVTNREWREVMGDTPSRWSQAERPVERVTWTEAVEFCRRLSARPEEQARGRHYRLPTEAEWEYACRAGTNTSYSFRTEAGTSAAFDHGWFANNSGLRVFDPESLRKQGLDIYLSTLHGNGCQTKPVGLKAANPWGLHDMHGNVWEWCSDRYLLYTPESATDPTGPVQGMNRVFRGGSWYLDVRFAKSAGRIGGKETFRRDDLGFRVAFTTTDIAAASPP